MPGQLRDLLRIAVEGEQVELAGAVGEEIDRVADPHRVRVVAAALGLGDLLDAQPVEREDPDPRGRAAPVVLPLAEPLAERGVGQVPPVGRVRRAVAVGHRQLLREAARGPDGEELREAAREDLPLRREQDRAVRREAADDVLAGMRRQPGRLAARGGDDEGIDVAVVGRGEGDQPPVGREVRVRFGPRVRRQSPHVRAVGPGGPEVVGVDEDDPPGGDVGVVEERRVRGVDGAGGRRRRGEEPRGRRRSEDGRAHGSGPGEWVSRIGRPFIRYPPRARGSRAHPVGSGSAHRPAIRRRSRRWSQQEDQRPSDVHAASPRGGPHRVGRKEKPPAKDRGFAPGQAFRVGDAGLEPATPSVSSWYDLKA